MLKPGGTLVIACWCQREETPDKPFGDTEKRQLQFLYDEWAHPYFISIQEFERLMKVCVWGGRCVQRLGDCARVGAFWLVSGLASCSAA